jgi:hypothetical protein
MKKVKVASGWGHFLFGELYSGAISKKEKSELWWSLPYFFF